MKLLKYFLIVVCLYSLPLLANEKSKKEALAPELKIFQDYLGTWEAEFKPAADGSPVIDVSHWERALNGKALRTLHSINDGVYGGESLIFFDKKLNKLVFYYFTTADFMTKGEMEVLSDNSFVAYEDVSGQSEMSKGISKVKSVSTLENNKMTVSTSYLKNGKWTEPETRTYYPSNKTVKFK